MKYLILISLLIPSLVYAANPPDGSEQYKSNFDKCKHGYTQYCEVWRGASPYTGHGH